MNLEKAIDVLTRFDNGQYACGAVTFKTAVKLGQEAMKEIQRIRHEYDLPYLHNLPSETKD